MALKYRIVYDHYVKYQNRNIMNMFTPYLLPLMLCAVLVLYLISSTTASKLYELFLPGDPAVTSSAFQELSDAMSRGEKLTDALDSFCETVMDGQ